jgi:hypothetical protein
MRKSIWMGSASAICLAFAAWVCCGWPETDSQNVAPTRAMDEGPSRLGATQQAVTSAAATTNEIGKTRVLRWSVAVDSDWDERMSHIAIQALGAPDGTGWALISFDEMEVAANSASFETSLKEDGPYLAVVYPFEYAEIVDASPDGRVALEVPGRVLAHVELSESLSGTAVVGGEVTAWLFARNRTGRSIPSTQLARRGAIDLGETSAAGHYEAWIPNVDCTLEASAPQRMMTSRRMQGPFQGGRVDVAMALGEAGAINVRLDAHFSSACQAGATLRLSRIPSGSSPDRLLDRLTVESVAKFNSVAAGEYVLRLEQGETVLTRAFIGVTAGKVSSVTLAP